MKTLYNSAFYYEGMLKQSKEGMVGSIQGLKSHPDIDNSTIRKAASVQQEMKNHFHHFLQSEIDYYEKRYKTKVTYVGVVGRLGFKESNPIGGVILLNELSPVIDHAKFLEVDIVVTKSNDILIRGTKALGTDKMKIFLLSDSKLKRFAPTFLKTGHATGEEMKRIFKEAKSLKYTKIGVQYFEEGE